MRLPAPDQTHPRRRGATLVATVGLAAVTASLLGGSPPASGSPAPSAAPAAAAGGGECSAWSATRTVCEFSSVGAAQSFYVPAWQTELGFEATGADGGSGIGAGAAPGGQGAVATVDGVRFTAGEKLQVNVGGRPTDGVGIGGWNGGGKGGAGAGGGATDVRRAPYGTAERFLVAGGGGGGGSRQHIDLRGDPGAGGAGGWRNGVGSVSAGDEGAQATELLHLARGGAGGGATAPGAGGSGSAGAVVFGCREESWPFSSGYASPATQGSGSTGGLGGYIKSYRERRVHVAEGLRRWRRWRLLRRWRRRSQPRGCRGRRRRQQLRAAGRGVHAQHVRPGRPEHRRQGPGRLAQRLGPRHRRHAPRLAGGGLDPCREHRHLLPRPDGRRPPHSRPRRQQHARGSRRSRLRPGIDADIGVAEPRQHRPVRARRRQRAVAHLLERHVVEQGSPGRPVQPAGLLTDGDFVGAEPTRRLRALTRRPPRALLDRQRRRDLGLRGPRQQAADRRPDGGLVGANRIDVLGVDVNGYVQHMYWNGYGWTDWIPWGGPDAPVLGSAPAISSRGPGQLNIVVRNQRGELLGRRFENNTWSWWQPLAAVPARPDEKPALVTWWDGAMSVLVRGELEDGLWIKDMAWPSRARGSGSLVGDLRRRPYLSGRDRRCGIEKRVGSNDVPISDGSIVGGRADGVAVRGRARARRPSADPTWLPTVEVSPGSEATERDRRRSPPRRHHRRRLEREG